MSTLDNLIAYWRMDESSGSRYDSVGSMRLDQSGTVGSDTGKLGSKCASLSTTSVGMHTAGTYPADFSADRLTIAGWYRLDSVSGSDEKPIALVEVTNGSAFRTLRLKYDAATGYIVLETSDGTTTIKHSQTNFGSLSVGTWYHLIGIWEDTSGAVLVNNDQADTTHVSMNGYRELSQVSFGNSSASHSFSVDDWGLWNESISLTDRSDLYNSGSGAIPPGLGSPAGSAANNAAFFGFHGF